MTRGPEIRSLKRGFIIAAAAMLCSIAAAQQSAPQGEQVTVTGSVSATLVVEQLLDGFVAAAHLPQLDARVEFLRDIVSTSHDLGYIAQLTVRRQWRDWSEQQRSAFVDAFSALSVMNYAARFGNVSEDSFRIEGEEPSGGSRVQVRTTIARADGTRVPIDFVLQPGADDAWRIANVVADGVSDLALKRAEYRAILERSGFEGLLAELSAQTQALAKSADE